MQNMSEQTRYQRINRIWQQVVKKKNVKFYRRTKKIQVGHQIMHRIMRKSKHHYVDRPHPLKIITICTEAHK